MPQTEHPCGDTCPIFAVTVLYGRTAQESPAFRALQAAAIPQLVWDNSPVTSGKAIQGDDSGATATCFHSDPSNPGLATPYNAALRLAVQRGAAWLVLLDQDTEVTEPYLREVLSLVRDTSLPKSTVALLPQLIHRGSVVSPVAPRTVGPHRPYAQGRPWQAFNSGAVLRVSALQDMGGFDTRFPLDYLDHATFAALQQRGGDVRVLHQALEHPLSSDTGAALSESLRHRQAAALAAEGRFYRAFGTPAEKRLLPLRFLRRALSVALHKRDWRSAAQLVKAALPNAETRR